MDKYYIDYIDNDGDLCHVSVWADNAAEAENLARVDYRDIRDLLYTRKA